MSVFVLCDPKYRHGVWCDAKIRGITDEAARRRIQPQFFTSLSPLKTALEKCSEVSSLIMLFDSMYWLQETVKQLSPCPAHIILSANIIDISLPVTYSLVGTDVDRAMCDMIDYLHACGKRRIAMVGVDRNSCNDRCRAKMLRRYLPDDECRVFYAEEKMSDCFDDFLKVQNDFDAAICTNDFLAICLVEHLKKHPRSGDKLFVLSHTDTVMARLYGDGITSMTTNFYNCGKMLVETHFNRLKYGLSYSHNLLPATLMIRGSTDNIPYNPLSITSAPVDVRELPVPNTVNASTDDIGRMERMLAVSDLVNLKLMYCLLCGYNYEKMSEFCFISPETARYRIRKIKTALAAQKKSDAAELIRTYIKKESLLTVIGELEQKNNQIIV